MLFAKSDESRWGDIIGSYSTYTKCYLARFLHHTEPRGGKSFLPFVPKPTIPKAEHQTCQTHGQTLILAHIFKLRQFSEQGVTMIGN